MMTNAKLVGVYHEDPDPASPAGSADSSGSHSNNKPVKKCLARRQVPLTIEPGLTMIMALDESCLACGSGGGHATSSVKGTNYTSERDSFLRKYDSLGKDELSAAFMVPFEDLLNLLGTEIPCVGCRRSVEALLQKLYETCESESLEPLVITEDALVSVSRNHIYGSPSALANLFVDQVSKLEAVIQSHWGTGGYGAGSKKSSKVGGRCAAHSLGLLNNGKRGGGVIGGGGGGHWLDTWECMERECQEEVVLIHFDLLRQTLDRYLKKHSFCSECTNMVNKAYSLLVHDEVHCDSAYTDPPPVTECGASGDCGGGGGGGKEETGKPSSRSSSSSTSSEDTLSLSSTGSATATTPTGKKKGNLYKGITACPADQHVHVECTPAFVSKLITMAEPELTGLRQERHAKTIEIAQKEVLTCIGICLYDRFQRIQQRLREGQQACDLLFLIALKSLKKSFEVAFESKQGISDLEKFCLELDEEERRKREKAQKKREKKSKQKLNRTTKKNEAEAASTQDITPPEKEADKPVDEAAPPVKPKVPCQAKTACQVKAACQAKAAVKVETSSSPVAQPIKVNSTTRVPGNVDRPVSLESMLKLVDMNMPEDEDNEENFIPLEDIKAFQARLPVVARQREELRKTLRLRFNQLCVNGL